MNFDLKNPIKSGPATPEPARPVGAVEPPPPMVYKPVIPIPQPERKKVLVTLEEISKGAASALMPLVRRFSSLAIAFMVFFLLADYTTFTTGSLHPGELVFSNTMIQLWTATYRLAYVYIAVLVLFSIVAPTLWTLYKPDGNERFDLSTFIVNHLTETQQVWLFFVTFWLNCLFFILLLMVRLPESVSVGP